jgi:hypothetical protein
MVRSSKEAVAKAFNRVEFEGSRSGIKKSRVEEMKMKQTAYHVSSLHLCEGESEMLNVACYSEAAMVSML